MRVSQSAAMLFGFVLVVGILFVVAVQGAAGGSAAPPGGAYFPLVQSNFNPLRLYRDDFGDSSSGWYAGDSGTSRWGYRESEYEILIREADRWAAAVAPVVPPSDYTMVADVRRFSGEARAYGLIFGETDWEHFYVFAVDPDRQAYALWRVDESDWIYLTWWTPSPAINHSDATNHLGLVRNGSQVAVYANDHLLTTVAYSSGGPNIGLYAETGDDVPAAVRFDNFEIMRVESADATRVPPLEMMPQTVGTLASEGEIPAEHRAMP